MRSVALVLVALAACNPPAAQPDATNPSGGRSSFQPRMTYPAGVLPAVIGVGDVDGDGRPDLVVAGGEQAGAIAVLLGAGGGAFAEATHYTIGRIPSAISVADLDGDGRADVAIVDAASNTAFVARATTSGGLGPWASYAVGPWPLSIVAADVNADGHVDLVVANNLGNGGNGISVLVGDGNGTFTATATEAAGSFPIAVGVADLDRDGNLDLAIADQGPVTGNSTAAVMLGRGDGTFAAPTMLEVGKFPDAIAIADLNGDGLSDLVVSNEYDGTTSVLLATGDGLFSTQQRYPVSGSNLALADLDGDGKPEIVIAGGDVIILHNAGDGTFDATSAVSCGCGRIALADLDGDGKPDLVGLDVVQYGSTWESRSNVVSVLLHNRDARAVHPLGT